MSLTAALHQLTALLSQVLPGRPLALAELARLLHRQAPNLRRMTPEEVFEVEEIRRLREITRLCEVAKGTGCKPAVNWMVFGHGREPTPAEFSKLVSRLDPELRPLLSYLLAFCPHSSQLSIQILLESDEEWTHPTEVFPRPWPTMEALYAAFEERRVGGDSSAEFLAIGERIKKASEFASALKTEAKK